ncbi:MAG: glycosyltransferase [Elusimicrobia bacterium]|nr:glycosyltransferase [Elusimicrobiota bacterium]
MKVTLFIPTLNELDGMKIVMPKFKKEWYDQLLIVDGGSTDGTIEWARERGYDVYVQKIKGLWHGYIEAYPLVRGDVMVTLSPDGNCMPEIMPLLIDKMRDGYDMVIASRYFDGAKSYDDDILTGFGNWMFTNTINLLFGGHYTDAMGIYRAYRTALIPILDLDKEETYAPEKLFFTKIGVEPILSVRSAKRKLKTAEIPADEPKRIAGIRKLQIIRWGAAYLSQILRETYYWK